MKYKKLIALFLTVCCIGAVASCSKTPDTQASSVSSSEVVESSEVIESSEEITEETEPVEAINFYSLEGMTAAEIKNELELYYNEYVPKVGQSAEEFRISLPKVPERVVGDANDLKCFVPYTNLETGHSRIQYINWSGFTKDDNDVFIKTDAHETKAEFDIVLQGKDLALELLDLYRQEINSIGFKQIDDQNQGDIWRLNGATDFVDGFATKTITVMIGPASESIEGSDFWTVTVKHFIET